MNTFNEAYSRTQDSLLMYESFGLEIKIKNNAKKWYKWQIGWSVNKLPHIWNKFSRKLYEGGKPDAFIFFIYIQQGFSDQAYKKNWSDCLPQYIYIT